MASDAVGMGLNLNIRRIIFHSLSKFDGAAAAGTLYLALPCGAAGRDAGFLSRHFEIDTVWPETTAPSLNGHVHTLHRAPSDFAVCL